jgi:hypothetical protein
MIGKQDPSETIHLGIENQFAQPVLKKLIIFLIEKDYPSLDSSSDDMLKGTGGIQARFSWHRKYLPFLLEKAKHNIRNVPPSEGRRGVSDYFRLDLSKDSGIERPEEKKTGAKGTVRNGKEG